MKIGARGIFAAALLLAALAPAARANSLEQISLGANGAGNGPFTTQYEGASADGTRVFMTTSEALTPDDTDGGYVDVYERANGITTRLSLGPDGGNGPTDAAFRGASDDGKHVFFETGEVLVAGETDAGCYREAELYQGCTDLYERFNGTTRQVGGAVSGNGDSTERFRGMSRDGTHVFFSTAEQLVPADTNNSVDIYESYNGVIRLVSTGSQGGVGNSDAYFKGCSADGSHVFFQTRAQLTSNDTNTESDIYDRSNGTTTTLVSAGSSGTTGPLGSSFKGASTDGSRVFFETNNQLTSDDTDNNTDVYERAGGTTKLVSTGPTGGNGPFDAFFAGASDDGTHVWFETNESLVPADTDTRKDVYDRSGGTTTLVSTGPSGGNGNFDASFQGASADGSRVWFGTFEQLAPTDTDTSYDIYERAGGTTTQVSLGPSGGNGPFDALFAGATRDGSSVFFETAESLVPADTNQFVDVYQRSQGTTTLVSTRHERHTDEQRELSGCQQQRIARLLQDRRRAPPERHRHPDRHLCEHQHHWISETERCDAVSHAARDRVSRLHRAKPSARPATRQAFLQSAGT